MYRVRRRPRVRPRPLQKRPGSRRSSRQLHAGLAPAHPSPAPRLAASSGVLPSAPRHRVASSKAGMPSFTPKGKPARSVGRADRVAGSEAQTEPERQGVEAAFVVGGTAGAVHFAAGVVQADKEILVQVVFDAKAVIEPVHIEGSASISGIRKRIADCAVKQRVAGVKAKAPAQVD